MTDPFYDPVRRERLRRRKLWLIADAAFMLRKSVWTVNRWVKAGLAVHVDSLTGDRYVVADEVRQWMLEHPTRRRSPH